MFEAVGEGDDEEEVAYVLPRWGRRASGAGLIPLKQFGERAQSLASRKVEALQIGLEAHGLPLTGEGSQRVDIHCSKARIVGTVSDLHTADGVTTIVLARPAKLKAKHYLDGCVRGLAMAAAGHPAALHVAALENAAKNPTYAEASLPAPTKQAATQSLDRLVRMMDHWSGIAVPLLPDLSLYESGRDEQASGDDEGQVARCVQRAVLCLPLRPPQGQVAGQRQSRSAGHDVDGAVERLVDDAGGGRCLTPAIPT